MKRNYFMLAAATMLFAACAETDVLVDVSEKENAPQAIGFETFADNITRQVGANDARNLKSYHDAFGVFAYKTTKNDAVMPNYKVVYLIDNDDLTWEYAGVGEQTIKYWDKNAEYSFYAYAPYAASGVTENAGVISIEEGEYAANENLQTWGTDLNTNKFSGVGAASTTASTDWMIAEEVEGYDNYTAQVPEVFSHIMSKLVVKLQSTVANTTINSVSVNNVHGKGSYNGTTWSTGNNAAKNIVGVVGNIATAQTPYYTMEYLLIPSNDVPKFSVNYTISGDTYNVENVEITGITSFEANTKYELTVTIDLNSIQFTASALDFNTPQQGGSVTIE